MGLKRIYADKRWKALRLEAKRRDGFRCTQCGAAGQLEVHHRIRARQAPELAFDLANVTTLCRACHITETLAERGQLPNAARQAWQSLLQKEI
ncbi:HNH endonuclease [Sinorhizobium medicae]|nr:HNH endonuclease [Sinorhizobium medicae]PND20959.1 endonuclease [Ensifer sp. MMN_5]